MDDSTILTSFVVLCVLTVSTPLGLAEEVSLTGSLQAGLKLYVDKTGGAIRFYREISDTKKTAAITASIHTITEVDANGKKINGQGHSVNANQIVFSSSLIIEDVILQPGNMRVGCIQLNGSLPSVGAGVNVWLTVYALKSNGTLTHDGETTNYYMGQVKFGVYLTGWSFAADGAYLDVEVNFKIPPGRSVTPGSAISNKPAKFDLGAGAYAEFSRKVSVDGTSQTMTDPYPKFALIGANNIITVRLPRFNSYASYDPFLSAGDQPADTLSSAPATTVLRLYILASSLLALIIHKSYI